MTTIRLALVSLGMMALCVSNAQMNTIEFEEYDLANGLHVILHEDHSVPIVAVTVMYHVGSKNESPDRTGFAHFFEHLLFEGSENLGRGEYDRYVQDAGGRLNANTSTDRTFYYELLPSNQLALGLWLESERMLHAKVEETGIETQRQVVKEERRQRIENRPYGTILEEAQKHAFKVHPYRWTTIGSMEHLDAASEADYQSFYANFYIPNNATLSIAGDLNMEEAKALIDQYFGSIPKGKEPYRPSIVEPPLGVEVRDTVYDNIQLPAVIHVYRIPAQGTKDYYAVNMLSNLLANGESSRLYKALVDEQQLALMVDNVPLSMEDPGISLAYGICNAGADPGEMEKSMDNEIRKVQEELISEQEFQKLNNQIEREIVSENSTVLGIAENLANYYTYYGHTNLINTEIEKYQQVTREDIRNAARTYFSKDNRVSLYYLPKQEQP